MSAPEKTTPALPFGWTRKYVLDMASQGRISVCRVRYRVLWTCDGGRLNAEQVRAAELLRTSGYLTVVGYEFAESQSCARLSAAGHELLGAWQSLPGYSAGRAGDGGLAGVSD